MKLSEIKLGPRHRQHLGDIPALAESIRTVGLLHPLVVDPKLNLIAGRRRLEALRLLAWTDAPVTIAARIADVAAALRAERDENTCRLDFTPSEAVAMAKSLEPFEKAEATRRQAAAGPATGRGAKPIGSEKFSEPVKGRAADKIAEAVGLSRPTLDKATRVVDRGDPTLTQAMDRGDVSISAAAAVAELPKPEQRQIIKAGPAAVRAKAKQIEAQRVTARRVAPPEPRRRQRDDDAEGAAADLLVKWSKTRSDLRLFFGGITDEQIEVLATIRPARKLAADLADLRELAATLNRWIERLEEVSHA
jgi:ParB family chromosome partitioning protein